MAADALILAAAALALAPSPAPPRTPPDTSPNINGSGGLKTLGVDAGAGIVRAGGALVGVNISDADARAVAEAAKNAPIPNAVNIIDNAVDGWRALFGTDEEKAEIQARKQAEADKAWAEWQKFWGQS